MHRKLEEESHKALMARASHLALLLPVAAAFTADMLPRVAVPRAAVARMFETAPESDPKEVKISSVTRSREVGTGRRCV